MKTGGPLGVLVVVVWIFTKTIKDQGVEHRAWMSQVDKDHQEKMVALSTQHLQARDVTHECIERNTRALETNAKAMLELAIAICPKKP